MNRFIAALVASAALVAFTAPAYAQNTSSAGAAAGQTINTGAQHRPKQGLPNTKTAGAAAGQTINHGNLMVKKTSAHGPVTGTSGAAAGVTLNCKKGTHMVQGYKRADGTVVKTYCRKTS